MAGAVQQSKRAFVKVLLRIASFYRLPVSVNRSSSDEELDRAFRVVARKCHPDKGGSPDLSKELHSARDEWKKQRSSCRRPRESVVGGSLATSEQGFRIRSSAVLLTYNGIRDVEHWKAFLAHVSCGARISKTLLPRRKCWGKLLTRCGSGQLRGAQGHNKLRRIARAV